MLSLSMLVLNSRDQQGKLLHPQKCCQNKQLFNVTKFSRMVLIYTQFKTHFSSPLILVAISIDQQATAHVCNSYTVYFYSGFFLKPI